MSDDKSRQPRFSVGHPIKRGTLNMEPTVPLDGPVTTGPLIRVGYPVKRATLTFHPVEFSTVEAALPPLANGEGERAYGRLHAMIGELNEFQSLYRQPGVRIDLERSGVRDGRVMIVLAPNDPTDAVETCKRVADYLFAAVRTIPGATVRVMVAGAPVYDLAG